jgi:SAM-dependent methyltransferase
MTTASEDREGSRIPIDASNLGQAAAWDGDEGAQWARLETNYDAGVGRYNTRLLDGAGIGPDDNVIDVGCGCGQSTRDAARIASSGGALGVDLSLAMIDCARSRALAEGPANVRFEQADAQVHPFEEGACSVVISRFGAMFFGDPVAAFLNIGRGLRPGGRLALVSWQALPNNEWLMAIRHALAVGRALPEPPSGVPGPFGLAEPTVVRGILADAGFEQVDVEDVREPVYFGASADDAFAYVRELGITNGLLGDLDEESKSRALDQLRTTLAGYETGEGVLIPSRAWLVTARRR